MMPATVIRATSPEVQAAFKQWLTVEYQAGSKFVVLEGLTLSGKTTLTQYPFVLNGLATTNIGMDSFLSKSIANPTAYLEAIDHPAMLERIKRALFDPPMVILQGAIAWPAVQTVVSDLGVNRVRRVYLKRMAKTIPDFWADEDFILEPENWPPTEFHRSIYRYHAEQLPWLKCDLIIERIEDDDGLAGSH